MNTDAIKRVIPHREPFLFIDEITEYTSDKITARRLICEDEPHFAGHYPGNPIMPGVLLCESVFQTAAVFLVKRQLEESPDLSVEAFTPVLSRIVEAKFKRMVKPGDEIAIEVTFEETVSKFHFLSGRVMVEGRVAASLRFALALLPKSNKTADNS